MQITSSCKRLGAAVLVCAFTLLTGCSIAPVTPQVNANSLEQGRLGVYTWAAPAPTLTTVYGVTDRLDIGAEYEQLSKINIWSKYSFINQDSLALAGIAGAFNGSSINNAKGYFAGAVVNRKLKNNARLFASYRYTRSTYTALDRNGTDLTDDELWWGIHSLDSIDLSETSQLNLGVSLMLRGTIRLHLGYGCQHHHKNDDPEIKSNPCAPLIGVSM